MDIIEPTLEELIEGLKALEKSTLIRYGLHPDAILCGQAVRYLEALRPEGVPVENKEPEPTPATTEETPAKPKVTK